MPPDPPPVSLRHVVRTWWPLAASWLLMSAEAPMISVVVARLADPLVNLAAYGGVVFPIALIVESPIIMLLGASTALSRDMTSYRTIRRYMMTAGAVLTALHLAVALTPLYDVVAMGLLGVAPEVAAPARIGLVLMTPWTWAIAYRRFNQGVLIRFGRSRTVGVGTVVRLSTFAAVLWLGYLLTWPGIVAASGAVACGVMAEATYTRFAVRSVVRGPLAAVAPAGARLDLRTFLAFYVPLALTSLMLLLATPIGSAAINRMPDALRSLAVWQVVGGVFFLLRSPAVALNEVVIALVDQPGATRMLRRFALGLMVGLTAAAVVVMGTPLADLWFGRIVGLEPALAAMARAALWIGLPLGALTVAQSWFQGILVNTRRTRGVSEAVALFLGMDALVLAAGVVTARFTGLSVAVLATTVAAAAQTVWLWRWTRSSLVDLDAPTASAGRRRRRTCSAPCERGH